MELERFGNLQIRKHLTQSYILPAADPEFMFERVQRCLDACRNHARRVAGESGPCLRVVRTIFKEPVCDDKSDNKRCPRIRWNGVWHARDILARCEIRHRGLRVI